MADHQEIRRNVWLSDAGGVRYHLRALCHRRRRWRAFRDTVATWFAAWRPPCQRLVLVGPSAGHTLPLAQMHGFSEIVALEPDPVARRWLAWRAHHLPLHFDAIDVLSGATPLRPLRTAFPDAAVLFCNVLGQVAPAGGGRWHERLADSLAGHHWASYHDVISTDVRPLAGAGPMFCDARRLETVLERFWPGGQLALVDHETFRLAGPSQPADYALWPLGPDRWHLIEWVVHRPPVGIGPVGAADRTPLTPPPDP